MIEPRPFLIFFLPILTLLMLIFKNRGIRLLIPFLSAIIGILLLISTGILPCLEVLLGNRIVWDGGILAFQIIPGNEFIETSVRMVFCKSEIVTNHMFVQNIRFIYGIAGISLLSLACVIFLAISAGYITLEPPARGGEPRFGNFGRESLEENQSWIRVFIILFKNFLRGIFGFLLLTIFMAFGQVWPILIVFPLLYIAFFIGGGIIFATWFWCSNPLLVPGLFGWVSAAAILLQGMILVGLGQSMIRSPQIPQIPSEPPSPQTGEDPLPFLQATRAYQEKKENLRSLLLDHKFSSIIGYFLLSGSLGFLCKILSLLLRWLTMA